MKNNKSDGNVIDLFSTAVTAILVAVVLVFYAGWMGNLRARDRLDTTARQYLLKMETEGCLNATAQSKLNIELAANGMTVVDLSGTTTAPVPYGQGITLHIRGNLNGTDYTVGESGVLQLVSQVTVLPVEISLYSTAKK
jgi:hypothetical protein